MELLALPCLPYFLTSLLLLMLTLRFVQKQATHSKSNLPPGPKTFPFIGSLHHLATASWQHHALRDLAQLHGPVMFLRAGETDLVVFSSREAAKEVMQTQDADLANRPAILAANVFSYGCKNIGFSNGTYWRQLRRIFASVLLSSKQVKYFSSNWQKEINSLLKSISLVSGKSHVNLNKWTYELSNNIIIRTVFGGKFKMRKELLDLLQETVELLSGIYLADIFPSLSWLDVKMRRRIARVHRKLDLVLEEIIQEHLKNQQQEKNRGEEDIKYDFVDALIDIKARGDLEVPITMDSIKAIILGHICKSVLDPYNLAKPVQEKDLFLTVKLNVSLFFHCVEQARPECFFSIFELMEDMDVFIAGTETSATTITWALTELIKHPEVMAKVQTEIRQVASDNTNFDKNTFCYLQLVIKETLRMHPPVPLLLPRQCKESCHVLGYTIPSGARLLINAWALGRDPDYWNDPDEFKPERFEMSSIDFKGQNFEFVPFGAGRRICPGLKFGVTVVEDALASLLLHFDWKLPDGMKPEDVDMTESFAFVSTKKEPLNLVPTLRVPLSDV